MATFGITVLTVGIRDKSKALKTLPIRLLVMNRGAEAVAHLFENKIDVVISHWDLIDIPNGGLLKDIIAAKPNLPTIAIVKTGDHQQEILARNIGVSAVLTDDIDDEYFRQVLLQIFDLTDVSVIRSISNVFQDKVCCCL